MEVSSHFRCPLVLTNPSNHSPNHKLLFLVYSNSWFPSIYFSEKSDTPSTVKSDDGVPSYHDNNNDSAFKPVNIGQDGGTPGGAVRPQWASNKDETSLVRDRDRDRDQTETRQKYINYRRRMERSRSLELDPNGSGLSNATYLRNSSQDGESLRYSLVNIDIDSDQSQDNASSLEGTTPFSVNPRTTAGDVVNSLTATPAVVINPLTTPAASTVATVTPAVVIDPLTTPAASTVATVTPAVVINPLTTPAASTVATVTPASTFTNVTPLTIRSIDSELSFPDDSSVMVSSAPGSHGNELKPRVIYVQGRSPDLHQTEVDVHDPFTVSSTVMSPKRTSPDRDFKSRSLHNLVAYDSDASGGEYRIIRSSQGQRSEVDNQPISSQSIGNLMRHSQPAPQEAYDETKRFSAPTSQEPKRFNLRTPHQRPGYSKSESNLISATDNHLDIPLQGAYSEMYISGVSVRIRRSEVAYYYADVERSRKEELVDYVSQQVLSYYYRIYSYISRGIYIRTKYYTDNLSYTRVTPSGKKLYRKKVYFSIAE